MKLFFLILIAISAANAADKPTETPMRTAAKKLGHELTIPFRMNFTLSREPLTTEGIWKLDPGELNPHHRRWVLKRDVYLAGLETVQTGDSYSIRGGEIVGDTVAYVRPAGSYFSSINSFPCSEKEADWFGTEEGSHFAADIAAKEWEHFLGDEKFKLELKLRNIHSEFPEVALKNARVIFTGWLADLDSEWRARGLKKVRDEEWARYQRDAKEDGVCSNKKLKNVSEPNWQSVMGPVSGPEHLGNVLAIAPARRWGGLFSVRVTLKVAEKDLVGKFLIDSGAATSVISPVFLAAQGIKPDWIEVPQTMPKRVYWSGGSGIGKIGEAAEVKVSGFPIDVHRFVITDTDFFGPPDSFATCCDGILGSDFLRLYTVLLDPSIPNEVRIYPREGFQFDTKDYTWIEASSNPQGQIVSGCTITPADSSDKATSIQGIQWDTGNESALQFATPLYRSLQKESRHWNLTCAETPISQSILISPKEAEYQSPDETLETASRVAAPGPASVGMEIMGRGQVAFDLSHGKIWFTKKGLQTPLVQNRSGLTLEFQYHNGERVLRVLGIHGKSEASKLPHAGIQVGTLITKIDSKDVSEMDQWEVDQRLSGAYGPTAVLEWHPNKKTEKTANLQVRFNQNSSQ
jgi:hypothetical protein